MKNKGKLLVSVLLVMMITTSIIALISKGQESVYTSPKTTLSLDSNTNFTIQSAAPLTWNLNQFVNFTIYLNVTGLPFGENLTISSIAIYFNIPDDPHRKFITSIAPRNNFTELNQQQIFNTSLTAPTDTDEFNITMNFVAFSTSLPENQAFEVQFPGDIEYISVKQDVVLPIINLPGFPNVETFWRWFFIFIVSLILIGMPGILAASFKLQEVVMDRKKKGGKKK
ncbi:MAG: hypothetical protein ACXABK_01345 [Candidatus Heimdallarchaeaceae archaeon]|jgi:hypothetical protein